MEPFAAGSVRAAYDAVADDYAVAFGDDLARLPVDRGILDDALAAAPAVGWVLEAGCGPGPASAHVAGRAPQIVGVDLSAGMLAVASSRLPDGRWVQADIRHLALRDGTCALVVAYYSLQHLHRTELPVALAELRRVLRGDGVLAVAMHLGEGDVLVDELLGHRFPAVGGALYDRDAIVELVTAARFDVQIERRRGPLPHEHDTERLYLVAAATTRLPPA